MNNAIIRNELKRTGLKYWQLAKILGISDATLSRWLRDDLPDKKQQQICQLINQSCGRSDDDQQNNYMIQKLIDRSIPKEKELEGAGSTYYYVCPECHGALDQQDHFCRYCGQVLKNGKAGEVK